MSTSTIKQVKQFFKELRSELSTNGKVPSSDALRDMFEAAYTYGCYFQFGAAYSCGRSFRKADVAVRAKEIGQALGVLGYGLRSNFYFDDFYRDLDGCVSPCAGVAEIADGLTRLMRDMCEWADATSYPVSKSLLMAVLKTLFVWVFLAGAFSDVLPDFCTRPDPVTGKSVQRHPRWEDILKAMATFKQKK